MASIGLCMIVKNEARIIRRCLESVLPLIDYYLRPQLFSNHLAFYYKAVLHEYLECAHIRSRDRVRGFYNLPSQDGARSRGLQKYRDDAAILERTLQTETDPFLIARYTFYLAQSYKDCDEPALALEAYQRRARLGFWEQEVFVSLYNAAQLKESLGHADAEVIQAYLTAYETCPTRAEALHGAIRFCRLRGKYQQGYILGKHARALPYPKGGLFVAQWIYDYGLLDEFSIVAYWAGHFRESFDACLELLKEDKIPDDYRERIRQNVEFSLEKLNNPNLRKLLP